MLGGHDVTSPPALGFRAAAGAGSQAPELVRGQGPGDAVSRCYDGEGYDSGNNDGDDHGGGGHARGLQHDDDDDDDDDGDTEMFEVGGVIRLKQLLAFAGDDHGSASSLYRQQLNAGGLDIQTRLNTADKVVVALPAYQVVRCTKADGPNSSQSNVTTDGQFVLKLVPGVETVILTRHPISKKWTDSMCTCKEFYHSLTRSHVSIVPPVAADGSGGEAELKPGCCHTALVVTEREAGFFASVAQPTTAEHSPPAKQPDELQARIIKGRSSQPVVEFKGKRSPVQYFTVRDEGLDKLTGMGLPSVGIVTSTPRQKPGAPMGATEFMLDCRSQLCHKRASAIIDPAAERPSGDGDAGAVEQDERFEVQSGSTLCRHISRVVEAQAAKLIKLVDGRAHAGSGGVSGTGPSNPEFDEDSGCYTLHEPSFYWKNLWSGDGRPLTLAEVVNYSKDPRLNLPTQVLNLTRTLEYYKSRAISLNGDDAPSVYAHVAGDTQSSPSTGSRSGINFQLTDKGFYAGPDLKPDCGSICSKDGCGGVLGDMAQDFVDVPGGTLTLYSLVGAFACKVFACQCTECNTLYRFTGHGAGIVWYG